jgi:hypothetical protein
MSDAHRLVRDRRRSKAPQSLEKRTAIPVKLGACRPPHCSGLHVTLLMRARRLAPVILFVPFLDPRLQALRGRC